MISEPDVSFETLDESSAFQQYAGQFWGPAREERATKRPVSLNKDDPSSTLFLKKPKGQVVWYPYTL